MEVHMGVLPVGEADETCERNDVTGLEGLDVLQELAHHAPARFLFAASIVGVPGPACNGELVEKHVGEAQVAAHGAHSGHWEVAIIDVEHHFVLRPHGEAGVQVPDLATVDLHSRCEGEEPRPREDDDLLESERHEDLSDFVRVEVLDQRDNAGPALFRDAPEGRDAQVVGMLVGNPDVGDPRNVLLGDDGVRVQGPAFVEDVSMEPGIHKETDGPGVHQDRRMADEQNLHGKGRFTSTPGAFSEGGKPALLRAWNRLHALDGARPAHHSAKTILRSRSAIYGKSCDCGMTVCAWPGYAD